MESLNRCYLSGQVATSPYARATKAQHTPACTFSVNVLHHVRRRGIGETLTNRIEVSCFHDLAEWARENLRLGDYVVVHGRLQAAAWEREGETRSRTYVNADRLEVLDPRAYTCVDNPLSYEPF